MKVLRYLEVVPFTRDGTGWEKSRAESRVGNPSHPCPSPTVFQN